MCAISQRIILNQTIKFVGPLVEIPPQIFTFRRYLLVHGTATGFVRANKDLLNDKSVLQKIESWFHQQINDVDNLGFYSLNPK